MARISEMTPRVLLVRVDEGTQYNLPHRHANVVASAGVLEEGRYRGASSYIREGSEPRGVVTEPALRDLKVNAALASNMEPVSYGWSVEYREPYTVDLQRAEQMVKALRQIGRRQDKVHELIGRPATFGQYLARAAQALSVTTVLVERFEHRNAPYRSVGDEERYIRCTVSQAARVVDDLVAAWHAEYPSTRERYERDLERQDRAS